MNHLTTEGRISYLQIAAVDILQQRDKWRPRETNTPSDSKRELGQHFRGLPSRQPGRAANEWLCLDVTSCAHMQYISCMRFEVWEF